jgi:arabinogalactan endo-1,4-beta-galactosidase
MKISNAFILLKQAIVFIVTPCLLIVSCSQKSADPVPDKKPVKVPYAWDTFCMGVDLSYVNEIEDYGGVYSDSGTVADPFAILKKQGANTVRVRLWHNPQWIGAITGGKLYSDLYDVEKTIRRAKDAGMAVNLDFHYSDTWTDPDHQETPAAWAGLEIPVLKDSVYNYTLMVLNYLKSKSLTPEMVQVGNEINPGMLFPAGQIKNDNWQQFGVLLNAGIKAVRDFSANSAIRPKIILHVAQLQNVAWWVSGIVTKAKVTDFDIVGISHYAKWSTMNRMEHVTQVIASVRQQYHKQVMIVETAYPWTGTDADGYTNIMAASDTLSGYPATVSGQAKYFRDLTQAIIAGGGTGIMYWEPAWITSKMRDKWGTGSSWDNCTLFDASGGILPSAGFMKQVYKF